MLGDVSSATTQHLFRCIFSTPEAILVVVNQKDAADSIGFVQSIHLEMPQMVLWHGQRPPKTTHTVILFWFFQSRIFSIPTTLGDGSTKLKWDFQIPSSDNWFPQQENTILSLGFQGVLSVGVGNKILKATPNLVLSDIDITESVHTTREGSDLYIWNLCMMSFLPICSQTVRINGGVHTRLAVSLYNCLPVYQIGYAWKYVEK